ncbi:hypothetical protein V6N11_080062 [Hibiscus sabdariffa]|uniref:Uncharacterized protein n=2 Tax=Hibiscus sabdariffa TaxID=183260 RepID=A0ABR1ZHZ2_9ROSI
MDMDVNVGTLGDPRQKVQVDGVTSDISRDMRGSPVKVGIWSSFRDMVTGRSAMTQQDNAISALDVELQADDVQIKRDEYEGLPVICFGCGKYDHPNESCGTSGADLHIEKTARSSEPLVDDRFDPWMQVSSRKRMLNVMRRGVHAESSGTVMKSRLWLLVGGLKTTVAEPSMLPVVAAAGSEWREQGRVLKGAGQPELVGEVATLAVVDAIPQMQTTEIAPRPLVAAMRQVVTVTSQLQSNKHVAVRVIEEGSYNDLSDHNSLPVYGPIHSTYDKGVKRNSTTSKISPRKGARSKKKDDMSRSPTVVAEWVAHLSDSLSMKEVHRSVSERQIVDSSSVPVHNEIQWIEDSTYEGDLQANL